MVDNFYLNCPAKSYSRDFCNFYPNEEMNENIRKKYGIKNYKEYKLFLQNNGLNILSNKNNSCWNNFNVNSKYPLNINQKQLYEQMIENNEANSILFNQYFNK